jgi:hypothetical protein
MPWFELRRTRLGVEAAVVEWSQYVPTDGSIELPPDPSTLDAIGRNHSIETALADLVDNSIDAGATHVLIRVVKVGGRPCSLYIVDNGRGMTPTTIDSAMTVGRRREYQESDLGHFGLGLKAASFSQARSLIVMSKAAGHEAVGRQWRLDESPQRGFACDVVPGHFAEAEFNRNWQLPLDGTGTVIRWDDVVSFAASNDPKNVEKILNHMITSACQHLGMVFHRFLEDEKISVDFEVHDVDASFVGPPIPVTPLNPFGYSRSARSDFPKTLTAEVDGLRLEFRCHLWPGRSSSAHFMLTGNATDHQGLYFYRRGRLLQAGGWVGVHAPHRRLAFARVEVEIDNEAISLFQFNPEKSRVLVGPEFARLASVAQSTDGMDLDQYFGIAEDVFKAVNKRIAKRSPMIHPGSGIPPRVRTAIEKEIPQVHGEKPIDFRWDTFPDDSFFRIDRDEHTLWLNKRYRKRLTWRSQRPAAAEVTPLSADRKSFRRRLPRAEGQGQPGSLAGHPNHRCAGGASMMASGSENKRHASAETFDRYLASRVPYDLPIKGTPRAFIFIIPSKPEIGLRVEVGLNAEVPDTGLSNIITRIAVHDATPYFEVAVTTSALFRDAYPILCSMADRIQISGLSPNEALWATLDKMSALLLAPDLLSREREVGLFGELLVLAGLINVLGAAKATAAWRGATEEHDFGLPTMDVEVKTTIGERRRHWIESLTQLELTRERPLWLVSHQLTNAGAGRGRILSDLVDEIRSEIGSEVSRDCFERTLADAGWHDDHRERLVTRWTRRSASQAYPVIGLFPRLTESALRNSGIQLARIPEVRYRVDLTDLTAALDIPEIIKTAIRFEGWT